MRRVVPPPSNTSALGSGRARGRTETGFDREPDPDVWCDHGETGFAIYRIESMKLNMKGGVHGGVWLRSRLLPVT